MNDVVIKRTNTDGKVIIENVPPDEFLISREAKNIQNARFICHRVRKTLSDLRLMYPDQDLDPADLGAGEDEGGTQSTWFGERSARYMYDESGINAGIGIGASPQEEA